VLLAKAMACCCGGGQESPFFVPYRAEAGAAPASPWITPREWRLPWGRPERHRSAPMCVESSDVNSTYKIPLAVGGSSRNAVSPSA